MKKLVYMLLISSSLLTAMEDKTPLAALPAEIQGIILSYVTRIGNYQDLLNLMQVDKHFQELVTDPVFLKEFAKELTKQDPLILQKIVQTASQKEGKKPLAVAFTRLFIQENPDAANKLLTEQGLILRNKPLVELFLEAGIAPNIRSVVSPNIGWTLLIWAISSHDPEIVKILLDKNADPNLPNKWGRTPLMHAAEVGNAAIVKLLLEHGADPSAETEDEDSALRFAQQYGFTDVIKLLKEAIEGTTSKIA